MIPESKIKTMKKPRLLFILCMLSLSLGVSAQQILIDRGVRAAGIWCFPLSTDTTTYLYLPSTAQLAGIKAQKPEFSFIKYALPNVSGESTSKSITQASGGAILHFLIELETDEEVINDIHKALKEITENEEVKLKPLIFESGNFMLVSSILRDGKSERMLMASGNAPVLEGSRIALSFELTPEKASLLSESFKMATPDISVVFDMGFSGLSDAFDAEMEVDWTEVRKHQSLKAGVSVYFVSAEVEKIHDELIRNNSIKLTTSGEDAKMEGMINRIYEKLTTLMFSKVEPERLPPVTQQGLAGGISGLLKGAAGKAKSVFSIHGGYKLKTLKTSGRSRMSFNSRAKVTRHHYITFNMGDLHKHYGDNPNYFRSVAIDDPAFQKRDVFVGIDGTLVSEMGQMINNVTVTLKKEHQNGEQTVRELVITPEVLNDAGQSFKLPYGSKEDSDRMKWLNYQYRTQWHFKGGGSHNTGWMDESSAMVNLYTPYKRTTIQLFGDVQRLEENNVRATIIELNYQFFGENKSQRVIYRSGDTLDDKLFEVTLPVDQPDYSYKITWIKNDGTRLVKSGDNPEGIIFVDEFPENE